MRAGVRAIALTALLALTGGCEVGDTFRVDGSFAEGEGAQIDRVWAVGARGSAEVEDGRFRISGAPASEALDLRFARGDEEVARLDMRGTDGARSIRLSGLWVDDDAGLVFPAYVEGMDGAVLVNGWRLGERWGEGERVEVEGIVLGRRTGDGTIAVRPDDETLPDVIGMVDDETRLETLGGESITLLDFVDADSVRLEGRWTDGLVEIDRLRRARPVPAADWGTARRPATPQERTTPQPARTPPSTRRDGGPPPHAPASGRRRGGGPPR